METFIGVVEKIVNGGWGLIRSAEGAVFLRAVCPGEVVKYSIQEKAKGINWGVVHEIDNLSQAREDPQCSYFGKCGGCSLLHVNYESQISYKLLILKENLRRIGKITMNEILIKKSPRFRYRNRVKLKGLDKGRMGFIKKGTNEVMEIDTCLNACDEINKFIEKWNKSDDPPFFHQSDLLFNPDNKILYVYLSSKPSKKDISFLNNFKNSVFIWKNNKRHGISEIKIGSYRYFISPQLFFQVNRFMWEKMISTVKELLIPGNNAADIFSGNGFFIPVLQEFYGHVIGIESVPDSVQLAKMAYPNSDIKKESAEKTDLKNIESIIVDPPRAGMGPNLIKEIIGSRIKRIIYVSCSTSSLARDLKFLIEAGYIIERMTMLDMFPNTSHIETVTLLTKD